MDWKYKISVVVPIYNTGKYLEHQLRSIVMQSIGFERNVQVIFVNDDSINNSRGGCARFYEEYPDNIKYISFDRNQGAGAAKKVGTMCAEGKYITFMDVDGLWSLNAFEAAVDFLERYDSEIDLVSADVEAYGGDSQPQQLNQSLDTEMLIDMNTEYRRVRIDGGCCIMKTETVRKLDAIRKTAMVRKAEAVMKTEVIGEPEWEGMHCFQEQQSCWEDTVLINQVMLEKQKYGMLPSNVRYYCRRERGNRAGLESYENNKWRYLWDLELLFQGIYEASMEKCGCFMPMMQYLMAYALAGCFTKEHNISNVEEGQYDYRIRKMLQGIEDGYLAEVCNADEFAKKVMLAFKHGVDFREAVAEREVLLAQNRYLQQRCAVGNANYKVLKKWFERKAQGRGIDSYFSYNGFMKIAVYGMSALGQYVVKELQNSEVEVVYGIDRRAESIEADIPIFLIDENLPEVDVIVVTAVFYYDEIQKELSGKINVPVISIEDIL